MQSSKIEGEILDRESLQSSIKKHFGLHTQPKKGGDKEARIAALLCSMYDTFDQPVSHEMLWEWHSLLFEDETHINHRGRYRSFKEPMQIVSNRYGAPRVFFEAPPSERVHREMTVFIDWLNHVPAASMLGKVAVAHIYFESIHPFEDGNGRVGRALVEKMLSQSVGRSALIAVSRELEKERKEYYLQLGRCNHTLIIQDWVDFFVRTILKAQEESMQLLNFLVGKSKLMGALVGQINSRQEKVLLSMFAEGPKGFQGGLSAEKYIAITKTARATATRDLIDLVQKGALIKTGDLRYTRYWLNLQ